MPMCQKRWRDASPEIRHVTCQRSTKGTGKGNKSRAGWLESEAKSKKKRFEQRKGGKHQLAQLQNKKGELDEKCATQCKRIESLESQFEAHVLWSTEEQKCLKASVNQIHEMVKGVASKLKDMEHVHNEARHQLIPFREEQNCLKKKVNQAREMIEQTNCVQEVAVLRREIKGLVSKLKDVERLQMDLHKKQSAALFAGPPEHKLSSCENKSEVIAPLVESESSHGRCLHSSTQNAPRQGEMHTLEGRAKRPGDEVAESFQSEDKLVAPRHGHFCSVTSAPVRLSHFLESEVSEMRSKDTEEQNADPNLDDDDDDLDECRSLADGCQFVSLFPCEYPKDHAARKAIQIIEEEMRDALCDNMSLREREKLFFSHVRSWHPDKGCAESFASVVREFVQNRKDWFLDRKA